MAMSTTLQELPDGHAFQISLCRHRGVGMCHKATRTGEFTVNSCPIMVGDWYYVKVLWVWIFLFPFHPIPTFYSICLCLCPTLYFIQSSYRMLHTYIYIYTWHERLDSPARIDLPCKAFGPLGLNCTGAPVQEDCNWCQ